MGLISSFLAYIWSFWPMFAVLIIIILSTILLLRMSTEKRVDEKWAEGIPEIKPGPIWGNDDPSATGFMTQYTTVYKAMKGLRYCLYYNGGTWARGNKRLLICDPDLVARIMITDFDHFVDNTFFSFEYMKVMGNVFGVADAQGDKWRKLRKMVNGPFTLPKMKKYLEYFLKANKDMVNYVNEESAKVEKMDVEDLVRRSVVNTLGSVGFGMEINAFKDKECEFMKQGAKLSEMWRWLVIIMLPSVATLFRVNCYNQKAEDWFNSLMRRHIELKRKDVKSSNDILSTLIKIQEENPDDFDQIALEKTVMQYLFDGYNTTAGAATGIIGFLISHREVLSKLQAEVDEVFDAKEEGDIDLLDTDINEMNYLDCIISEAMRMAAVSVTSRRVTKPWTIPGTDITVPVGVGVYIPIMSFHKDPEYWENPEEFNPERFNTDNKSKIRTGTYAPFGLGPRQCLGNNYAKFTMKIILIYLVRFFDLENVENLPKDFKMDPNTLFTPLGGCRAKFHKRNL